MLIEFQKKYVLTNRETALLCGCSLPTIQKWRSGSVPLPEIVRRFLTFLDTAYGGNNEGLKCFADQVAGALEEDGVSQELVQEFAEQTVEAAGGSVQKGTVRKESSELLARYKEREAAAREIRERAEEITRLRDDMLAEMSYQLRAPMNAIIGAGQLLQEELRGERWEQIVNTIMDSGDGMMRLIDSMEQFSTGKSPQYEEEEQSDQITALVAEDSSPGRVVIDAMLRRLGCRTDVVENGLEAIRALERKSYDVVFMDIAMPVMDGEEAVREIRRREKNKGLEPAFICATTAYAMPGDREKYLAAGMDEYLPKPIRSYALAELIQKRCGK